jgi:threonylcarbamoyladenosine tRNA methylthiotransferase MtaB
VKRVAFCTLGCKLNQADTESLRALLSQAGWTEVSAEEEADVIVVNTCTVTASADARSRQMIRRFHSQNPRAKIIAAGCYVQRAPAEVAALPGIGALIGAADRARIAEYADQALAGETRLEISPIQEAKSFLDVPFTEMSKNTRAFVKVQEGCGESCTFCIVPQTRGLSRSRQPESVARQVRSLVEQGAHEVVLTGVHLGEYGVDLAGRRLLRELLEEIVETPGLTRVRLSSIEPSSVTPDLLDLVVRERRIARHFHIPMQSGSEEVLRSMKRRCTRERFADLSREIAGRIPGCAIGSDVLCGFPGETESHFQETFDLLQDLPVTYLHAFSYSVRPGSEAERMGDPIPGDVKRRRTGAVRRLSDEKERIFRESQIGQTALVLLEKVRRGGVPFLAGHSDNYLFVELGEGERSAPLVRVRITGLVAGGCQGELEESMVLPGAKSA